MAVTLGAGANRAQQVDSEELRAQGFHVTQSDHLTLVTTVLDRPDVAEFNDVFEKAVSQWCEYFAIPRSATGDWHITCCVMRITEKDRFRNAGLMTDDLPPFPAGYQSGSRIWIYLQDGDYYTRHLLIHEGTHAFMQKFLGGYGAAWYAEGMAELLGVHQWKDGQLKINYDLRNREEAPYWGRVKLVRKERDAGSRRSLEQILAIDGTEFREVRTYGWAWAACEFFDSHPDFQETFRKLPAVAGLPPHEFNRQFQEALSAQWPEASHQWNLMIDEIEYGYDVARSKPVEAANRESSGSMTGFTLAVDRGWQSSGIEIQKGQTYRISAEGRFQVKHDGHAWPCEAGGVTLEYYQGRPLGRLLAAIRTDDEASLEVIDIGTTARVTFAKSGTLFLRINDSPAAWGDNQGELKIVMESLSD